MTRGIVNNFGLREIITCANTGRRYFVIEKIEPVDRSKYGLSSTKTQYWLFCFNTRMRVKSTVEYDFKKKEYYVLEEIPPFRDFKMPIVREKAPVFANEMVEAQPMTLPSGHIFHDKIDWKKGGEDD